MTFMEEVSFELLDQKMLLQGREDRALALIQTIAEKYGVGTDPQVVESPAPPDTQPQDAPLIVPDPIPFEPGN